MYKNGNNSQAFFHHFGESFQRDDVCGVVCYLLIIANDISIHQTRITGISQYRKA